MQRDLRKKNKTSSILAAAVLAALPTLSWAQEVPALAEGPISAIVDDNNGGVWITVVDMNVHIPASVFTANAVTSPGATLTQAQLLDEMPLPGRGQPGFLGGTAIINGVSSLAGGFTGADLFVEPAENVVLGIITANDACNISIEGVKVQRLADPRLPFGKAINGNGFEIDYCSSRVGGSAAIEGYFASGMLYVFAYESDDADPISTVGVTSITRAICRGGRLEVRGATTVTSGEVTVSNNDTVPATPIGTETIVLDTVTTTGSYRFRQNVGSCPAEIRVDSPDGSFAISGVD